MRALVQRVKQSHVEVDGETIASIDTGLLALIGFCHQDSTKACERMLDKLAKLRIFQGASGKMTDSLRDIGGSLLLVPQFTLYADTTKGNRPSFIEAAAPEQAAELFDYLATISAALDVPVALGSFQATMQVHLINDGPVSLMLEI